MTEEVKQEEQAEEVNPLILKLQEQLKTATDDADRFRAKHGEAEKHRKAQEDLVKRAAEDALKASGDVGALEKSYIEKARLASEESQSAILQLNGMIHSLTAGAAATRLAAEIALPGSADVLLPHIQARISVENQDGKSIIRILDKDGKPSAMTLDELKAEFITSPSFAPIIAGSKASGSGHTGGGGGTTKKFEEYTSSELVKLRTENVKEYSRIVDERNNKQ